MTAVFANRATAFVATTTLIAAGSLSLASGATASHSAIDWGKVLTVWTGHPQDWQSLTTDNGMIVAAWIGRHFSGTYVAVRPAGQAWSAATKVANDAATVQVAADGDGAWIAWQGFKDVEALQVSPDGALSTPDVIGDSADRFLGDPHIAVGADGAVAVTYQGPEHTPTMLSYRPAGGAWQQPVQVPFDGSVDGVVVSSAGTAELVISKGTYLHAKVSYVERAADGTWSSPFTVSGDASLVTVAGNADGDLVVGWAVDQGTTSILAARYKASDGSFDDTHHFDETAPEGSGVALAMSASGSLAAAYEIAEHGSQQVQMTPADSSGVWLDPQTLSMKELYFGVAMNSAGAYVVTAHWDKGLQLVSCDASNVCSPTETHGATGYRVPSVSRGPGTGINVVWGKGCKGEACVPRSLVAQRGS